MEQLLKDLSRFTDSLSTDNKVDSYFLVKSVDGGHVLSGSISDHLVKTTVLTKEEVKELMQL